MKFYSHAKIENGVKLGSKLLSIHLDGVYQKALSALSKNVSLDIESEKIQQTVRDIAIYHDLGKYTAFFQNYLLGKKVENQELKKHSRIGAFALLNKYKENPLVACFLYFIVLNHHGRFADIKEIDLLFGEFDETRKIIFEKQMKTIQPFINQLQNEIGELELEGLMQIPDNAIFRKTLKKHLIKTPNIRNYFTINYLFSLLIEADKLDASTTEQYQRKSISELAVESFIGKAELSSQPTIADIKGYEQNKLRNYVRAAVLENLKRKDILEQKLFTLTAPTGIGKTLASLDFALRLKRMIQEKENYEPQIIYGLPFINIIEQGLKVYSDVFKNESAKSEINILAHYQYADVFGKDTDEGENYNQKLMSMNTWQSDIVITSFVQFFETLINNRNKNLLKFNHLAGSIIILDEVQTLRLKQLPIIGAALYFLSKFLNARILLMTATKPKIFELANKEILLNENEKAEPLELLTENEIVFKKFNRTKIIPLFKTPIIKNQEFYEIFKEKRPLDKSCLVVCNTVQRSIDIFNELKKNNISPLYYLSTNIVPAVRMDIIKTIKNDLSNNNKFPVLVSTQVVEAGVDLDFDMGFRDLAPIDSIVQVAGRINRENNIEREGSPLYVIEFEKENNSNKSKSECALVYDSLTRNQIIKALENKQEIIENDYLQLIEEYFSGITETAAFNESREFFESMKTLRYDGDKTEFPVSYFKIIEESPWAISVFVELNDSAKEARKAYNKLMKKEIEKEEFDKDFKRTFNQYIIAVPEKFAGDLENLNEYSENIKLIRNEHLINYYDLETGFIRKGEAGDRTIML
jgi:CRISPR-associated endonuclease/helicase Cas3